MLELTNESITGPGAALIIMAAGFGLFWRYVGQENRLKREENAKQWSEARAERDRQLQAHENNLKELRISFEAALDKITSTFESTVSRIHERDEMRERLAEERFKLVLRERLDSKEGK